jgi:hypothetical protein
LCCMGFRLKKRLKRKYLEKPEKIKHSRCKSSQLCSVEMFKDNRSLKVVFGEIPWTIFLHLLNVH